MNIIENLYKKKEKIEIIKWVTFDHENLETKEEKYFPGEKTYVLKIKKQKYKRKNVLRKELLEYIEELRISLHSGLTIIEALELAQENIESKELLFRSEEMRESLKNGDNFSTSWNKYFPEEKNEIGNLISIYEKSGAILQGLEKIVIYLKEKNEYKKKIFKSFYYPVFVFLLASLVLLWFINFFVPSMMDMISKVLELEDYLRIKFFFIKTKLGVNVSAIIILLFAMYLVIAKKGRKKFLKSIAYIGFLKKIVNVHYREAFFHRFYHLVNSGFSIVETLEVLKKDTFFDFCRKETESCKKVILEGSPLSDGLSKYRFVEKRDLEIVKKGEARGTLTESFYYIHNIAKQKKKFYLEEFLTYIEPFMIFFAGITVGTAVYFFYKLLFSYTFTLI